MRRRSTPRGLMTTVSSVAVDFGASFFATNTSTASTSACNISAVNFVSGSFPVLPPNPRRIKSWGSSLQCWHGYAMNLSDFDYELPAGSIAQWPLAERDASRMLLLDRATGHWDDRQFRELPVLLRGDELVVLNDVARAPGASLRASCRSQRRAAWREQSARDLNF